MVTLFRPMGSSIDKWHYDNLSRNSTLRNHKMHTWQVLKKVEHGEENVQSYKHPRLTVHDAALMEIQGFRSDGPIKMLSIGRKRTLHDTLKPKTRLGFFFKNDIRTKCSTLHFFVTVMFDNDATCKAFSNGLRACNLRHFIASVTTRDAIQLPVNQPDALKLLSILNSMEKFSDEMRNAVIDFFFSDQTQPQNAQKFLQYLQNGQLCKEKLEPKNGDDFVKHLPFDRVLNQYTYRPK